jgi:hypothetical protein
VRADVDGRSAARALSTCVCGMPAALLLMSDSAFSDRVDFKLFVGPPNVSEQRTAHAQSSSALTDGRSHSISHLCDEPRNAVCI